MLILNQRTTAPATDSVALAYDERKRRRLKVTLASGVEAGIFLKRGDHLHGGDKLAAENGSSVVEILAAPEKLIEAVANSLLQLASPALPVGAYTYSQGLEWAVESGVIRDERSSGQWIADLLQHGIGRYEAPLVFALMAAWTAEAHAEVRRLNSEFLASRESAELRAETAQMGFSMRRLLRDLRDASLNEVASLIESLPEVAFPTAWAGIAAAWKIAPDEALTAYLWSWAENQVMAALKAVPLGQAAGQRLLAELGGKIPAIAVDAVKLPETAWSNFTPAFAIACARHETQYSRLFRS